MSIQATAAVFRLDIKAAQKWILVCMADHADSYGGEIWPSIASIATDASMSERSVQRIISSCLKNGLIEKYNHKKSPSGFAYRFVFMSRPLPPRARVNVQNCPPELRIEVIEAFSHTCQYCCGIGDAKLGPNGKPWHVDRIIPGSRGGGYNRNNITLACSTCNLKKRTKAAPEATMSLEAKVPSTAEPGCHPRQNVVLQVAPESSLDSISLKTEPGHTTCPECGFAKNLCTGHRKKKEKQWPSRSQYPIVKEQRHVQESPKRSATEERAERTRKALEVFDHPERLPEHLRRAIQAGRERRNDRSI